MGLYFCRLQFVRRKISWRKITPPTHYTRTREALQEDKGVTKCDTLHTHSAQSANDKKDGERNVHPSIKNSRLILRARL